MQLNPEFTPLIRLVVATVIGVMIGLERQKNGKIAGIRTFGTLALGTAAICIFALKMQGMANGMEWVIIASIIIAIGFISARMFIIDSGNGVQDFSNITAIWCTAAISILISFGFYTLGGITAFLLLLIFLLKDVYEKK
ncbi:MAG TPA: MgtC/SapB family protein [Chitinophagales bacterium]|nr:MgtC/SapB family protein [Chitinophagales bacterium]HNL83781.1 MgtC/SapB family protein [Chitinophagales bacterium]